MGTMQYYVKGSELAHPTSPNLSAPRMSTLMSQSAVGLDMVNPGCVYKHVCVYKRVCVCEQQMLFALTQASSASTHHLKAGGTSPGLFAQQLSAQGHRGSSTAHKSSHCSSRSQSPEISDGLFA